jgi:beta-glucosidase-like glycosyl hydrolase
VDSDFGRFFIVGFRGTSLSKEDRSRLLKIKPSGIIFFDENIQSRIQVRTLIEEIRKLLGREILIGVDQEGGKVERLRKISTSLPSLRALGNCPQYLKEHSYILAFELLDLGFNLVFGPCADLATHESNPIIGTRSLGPDEKKVSAMLPEIIKIYQSSGLIACVKHFPGHGSSDKDSHEELPILKSQTSEYLRDLEPFRSSINAGVLSLMSAHLLLPNIDSKFPASLSKTLIEDELKSKLGFQGLIITDDLSMKALSKLSPGDRSKNAIRAGNHLVLWNQDLSKPLEALEELNKLSTEEKEDFSEKLKETKRLISLSLAQTVKKPSCAFLGAKLFKAHKEIALKIALDGLRFNKVKDQIIESLKISAGLSREITDPRFLEQVAILAFDHPKIENKAIEKACMNLIGLPLDYFRFGEIDLPLDSLFKYKNLILLSFQVSNFPKQEDFIKTLRNLARWNIIQCSCDNPDLGADIDIWGPNEVHIEALLKSILE